MQALKVVDLHGAHVADALGGGKTARHRRVVRDLLGQRKLADGARIVELALVLGHRHDDERDVARLHHADHVARSVADAAHGAARDAGLLDDVSSTRGRHEREARLVELVGADDGLGLVALAHRDEHGAAFGEPGACGELALEERLAEMGPMTVSEKRLLVLAILGILGFMVEPWAGVNAVYVLCLVALFCYMPGMKIMEPSSFNNLNIVFLVFVAGCMAIGFVAGEVGANKWAVSSIIPFLKELPPTLGVLCSYLAGVITNLLLTPFAATVAFTPAFGELGVQMGVNPLPLFYAFEYGLDQYFFPYEGVMFLYIFTTGCVTLKHVIPTMIARCIVAGAFIAVIAIPYWTFIGIM